MRRFLFKISVISAIILLGWGISQLRAENSSGELLGVQAPLLYATHSPVTPKTPETDIAPAIRDFGKASYYDYVLASGWSSKGEDVCASRDYPRGSYLRVIHQDRFITCVVTDYGPDASIFPDRIIDLSSSAFSVLAPLSAGVIDVEVEQIQ